MHFTQIRVCVVFKIRALRSPRNSGAGGGRIEFGTIKDSARPFIVPTVEHTRANIAKIFREEFFKQFARQMVKRANKVQGVRA